MVKRASIILLMLFSVIAFSGFAWATVEGTWDVWGTETVKVSVKGHSQSARVPFLDEFTFYDDGSFEMFDVSGSWMQKKTKFTIYLNADDLAQYFADSLSEELDSDVWVTVTKVTFSGTQQRNGTIKGSFKFNLTLYIEDYDLTGKLTVSGNFSGTAQSDVYSSAIVRQETSPANSIVDAVKERMNDIIQAE